MAKVETEPRGALPNAVVARMPTGAKVFLILLGWLLPLALIALFMTLRTTRLADVEAQTRLRITAEESATLLRKTVDSQLSDLHGALDALERDPRDAPSCARASGTFAALLQSGARFVIADRRGGVLCGARFDAADAVTLSPGNQRAAAIDSGGLVIRLGGERGGTATAFYPAAALEAISRPSGFVPAYAAALSDGAHTLSLRALPGDSPLTRHETTAVDLDLGGIAFQMTMPGAPINGPMMIATLIPLLMWLAAAAIGWFVVDRLLIRPLRRLRASVSAYRPGEIIDPARLGALPAQEIRELGDTFRELSRTVRVHEAELAEGLVRQTRLTREVHHRVKNNLQVIASLINLHARSARSTEASEAYASIQRRVDALAVVHRHHFAELEENQGLELRSVIGELAANLRATAPEASGLDIVIDVEPLLIGQDGAIAVAFLLTELVELAMNVSPAAHVRISIKSGAEAGRAILRVVASALVETPALTTLLDARYGRVIGGLVRQLRSKLHYDAAVGAYEVPIAAGRRQ